jgi:hypothetical protein
VRLALSSDGTDRATHGVISAIVITWDRSASEEMVEGASASVHPSRPAAAGKRTLAITGSVVANSPQRTCVRTTGPSEALAFVVEGSTEERTARAAMAAMVYDRKGGKFRCGAAWEGRVLASKDAARMKRKPCLRSCAHEGINRMALACLHRVAVVNGAGCAMSCSTNSRMSNAA